MLTHWNTGKASYNDTGLYDTPSTASDIVLPVNSSLLTVTLFCSVITTLA
jgi:hypothetical protein